MIAITFTIYPLSAYSNNKKEEKKKSDLPRIEVIVKGVKDPLLRNIYSSLAIYRFRNSKHLQQISVTQLYRQAEKDIRNALMPYGYYNPTISSSFDVLPFKDVKTKRWRVEFIINQGDPVLLMSKEIKITGEGQKNKKISTKAAFFALKNGHILNQNMYEEEKKSLLNTAIAEGYLDATFSKSEIRVDPESNKSWITLILATKERYCFGKTNVITEPSGFWNKKMLDGYLPYKEGQSYSVAKLFELQSILYRTGYFSAVLVQGKIDKEENGAIPVEVQLMPFHANNSYTIGLGYATDTGARARLNWKSRLFTDGGDRMGGSIEVAENERNIFFSYEKPQQQNPRYDKYTLSSSWQDKSWEDTKTRLLTISGGREYSGPLFNLAGGVELRNEIYEIHDGLIEQEDDSATLLIPFATGGIVKADDAVNPQNGIRLSFGAKGAVEGAISDTSFFQWTLGGKVVFTPSISVSSADKKTSIKERSDWQFVGRATFGMTMVDSINSIPPSLRFYAGGDNSVRGYAYKSIGPKENDRGAIIGGRYLSVQSVEVERFFGKYFGVAAFWDIGTATDDLSLDYHQGAGLGLRGRFPFGEVKLDAASAISEDGYPVRIHFSVGGNL